MTDTFDVAIVGSGAAGSVMAWQLAKAGLRVVVLEKGMRHDPTSFQHSEFNMMPRVYKHGGFQTTADHDLVVLQGSTVGGSTVINNAIWKRADLAAILRQWAALGAPLEESSLTEGYAEMERVLKVGDISLAMANAASKPFLDGCHDQNIPAKLLKHNREACIGCGWCNYGCRYNRKTSMLVTLIPWAERLGAVVLDQCQNVRLHLNKKRVDTVTYVRNGGASSIRAAQFVVAAGSIGSSEVLLQSGINPHGRVGRGFHVLGGATVNGRLPQQINGFDGIGLTCIADAPPNCVIESFFSPPGAFAVTLGGWFEEHAQRMLDYPHFMQAGIMVGAQPRGRISLNHDGSTKIDFQFSSEEVVSLREGIKVIARAFFAAGATYVLPSTYHGLQLTGEADLGKLDTLVRRPDDLLLGSAHPQGGNTINEDPKKGVVDTKLRVHGVDNLFVADASVFPTNIVVNCQATVMAMSHMASKFVAEAIGGAPRAVTSPPPYETRKPWSNHDKNQSSVPLRTYRPSSLEEIVAIVREAERLGVSVRAIGSSHSWSDVAVTSDFLILPTSVNRTLPLDESLIKPEARSHMLVEVEAGITLHALNDYLDKRGLALANMGGYDGQTVAGVISTSTHGSGITFGPLAEMIQSIELVASGGTVYRVEPSGGITNAVSYAARFPDRTLIQDDRWFRAVVVSMGCTGVFYSLILSVRPSFLLQEVRELKTWEEIKPRLRDGEIVSSSDHFELLLNPYATDATHKCLITTRTEFPASGPISPGERHRHFFTELVASLGITGPALRRVFDTAPTKTPELIDGTLRGLRQDSYINKSYKVFNIGAANDVSAYSQELAFSMRDGNYIDAVDRLLDAAKEAASAGRIYQSGPIALRFVKGTEIFLSPQQGDNTCMAEMIFVKDTMGCLDLMYRYEHEGYKFAGRPHWGQLNSMPAAEVHRLYPHLQDWLSVHATLNRTGTFDSPFSWRTGLTHATL